MGTATITAATGINPLTACIAFPGNMLDVPAGMDVTRTMLALVRRLGVMGWGMCVRGPTEDVLVLTSKIVESE